MGSKIWFTAVLLLAVSVGFEAFPTAVEDNRNEDSNEMDYPKDYDDDDDEYDDDDNDYDGNDLNMEDTGRARPPRRERRNGKPKQPSRQRGQKPAKGRAKPRRPWG